MPQKQQETKTGRVGEKGRVTLPAEIRSKYKLKEGDIVSFKETSEGILITPQVLVAQQLLSELQTMFEGTTLEELIESNRPIRQQLAKEMYGIDTTKPTE